MAFTLRGILGLDSSGFDRGIERANQKTSAFTSGMKGKLAGAFSVGAILAGLNKVDEKLQAMIDRATEIKLGSSRSGLDPTTYQQFDNVLKSTGMSADRAFNSMERLAEAVDKVKKGEDIGGKLAASFGHFGVTMDDIKRKEYQSIFFQISDAMKGMPITSETMTKIGDLLGGKAGDLVAAMKVGFNSPVANRGLLDDNDLKSLERLKEIGQEARGPWKALWQEILLGASQVKETVLTVGSHMLSPSTGGGTDFKGNALQARLNAAKQEKAMREAEAMASREKQAAADAEAAKIQQSFAARKASLEQSIAQERFSLLTNEEKLYVLQRQAEVLREMGKNLDPQKLPGMENKLALLQNATQQRALMGAAGSPELPTAAAARSTNLTSLQQIGAAVSFAPLDAVKNEIRQTAQNTAKTAAALEQMKNNRHGSDCGGVQY